MIKLECTPEQAARWAGYLKYVKSLCGAVGSKITPEKADEVIKKYTECGSKRMASRDLHIAPLTVTKILDAQGVPA